MPPKATTGSPDFWMASMRKNFSLTCLTAAALGAVTFAAPSYAGDTGTSGVQTSQNEPDSHSGDRTQSSPIGATHQDGKSAQSHRPWHTLSLSDPALDRSGQ
jgi:hypothetical protein